MIKKKQKKGGERIATGCFARPDMGKPGQGKERNRKKKRGVSEGQGGLRLDVQFGNQSAVQGESPSE